MEMITFERDKLIADDSSSFVSCHGKLIDHTLNDCLKGNRRENPCGPCIGDHLFRGHDYFLE